MGWAQFRVACSLTGIKECFFAKSDLSVKHPIHSCWLSPRRIAYNSRRQQQPLSFQRERIWVSLGIGSYPSFHRRWLYIHRHYHRRINHLESKTKKRQQRHAVYFAKARPLMATRCAKKLIAIYKGKAAFPMVIDHPMLNVWAKRNQFDHPPRNPLDNRMKGHIY